MATVEVPESSGRKDMTDGDGGLTPATEEVARGRRKLLTGGLAAGAAALGAWSLASAQPARADSGDNLIIGQANAAGALTALDMLADPYSFAAFAVNTSGQGPAIAGNNDSSGPGVKGTTSTGTGVASAGVIGEVDHDLGVGVYGKSDVGVQGDSPGGTSTQIGVKGTAEGPQGVGVQGTGFKGVEGRSGNYGVYGAGFFGVYGASPVGAGVFGDSTGATVPGVLASNQVSGGLALSVQGFPKFSTAGRATVKAHSLKVTVTVPQVVASDSVLATVQGSGSAAVKNAAASAGKITITLAATVSSAVTVAYLIIRT
jgi:hypothetical protein